MAGLIYKEEDQMCPVSIQVLLEEERSWSPSWPGVSWWMMAGARPHRVSFILTRQVPTITIITVTITIITITRLSSLGSVQLDRVVNVSG